MNAARGGRRGARSSKLPDAEFVCQHSHGALLSLRLVFCRCRRRRRRRPGSPERARESSGCPVRRARCEPARSGFCSSAAGPRECRPAAARIRAPKFPAACSRPDAFRVVNLARPAPSCMACASSRHSGRQFRAASGKISLVDLRVHVAEFRVRPGSPPAWPCALDPAPAENGRATQLCGPGPAATLQRSAAIRTDRPKIRRPGNALPLLVASSRVSVRTRAVASKYMSLFSSLFSSRNFYRHRAPGALGSVYRNRWRERTSFPAGVFPSARAGPAHAGPRGNFCSSIPQVTRSFSTSIGLRILIEGDDQFVHGVRHNLFSPDTRARVAPEDSGPAARARWLCKDGRRRHTVSFRNKSGREVSAREETPARCAAALSSSASASSYLPASTSREACSSCMAGSLGCAAR